MGRRWHNFGPKIEIFRGWNLSQKEKKGKAGRKPKPRRLVAMPPVQPPGLQDPAEVAAYQDLLQALEASPFCSVACVAALEQGARLKVRIDRIRAQTVGLESDLVKADGRVSIHPLVKALSAAEAQFRNTLGVLCLTPRAISSARLRAGERLKPVAPLTEEPKKAKRASGGRARVLKMLGVAGGSSA